MKQIAIGILLLINIIGHTQEPAKPIKKFYFGVSPSIGFFNPVGVNNYIKNKLEEQNITINFGYPQMFMNYGINVLGSYYYKQISITGSMELSYAYKYVSIPNGTSHVYSFERTSLGLTSNYYIPLSSRRSLFIGAGVLDNFMFFERFKASSIGGRAQAGLDFKMGRIRAKVYGRLNFMQTAHAIDGNKSCNLNYSGFDISGIFEF